MYMPMKKRLVMRTMFTTVKATMPAVSPAALARHVAGKATTPAPKMIDGATAVHSEMMVKATLSLASIEPEVSTSKPSIRISPPVTTACRSRKVSNQATCTTRE